MHFYLSLHFLLPKEVRYEAHPVAVAMPGPVQNTEAAGWALWAILTDRVPGSVLKLVGFSLSAEQHASQRSNIWVTKVQGRSRQLQQPGMKASDWS